MDRVYMATANTATDAISGFCYCVDRLKSRRKTRAKATAVIEPTYICGNLSQSSITNSLGVRQVNKSKEIHCLSRDNPSQ